MLVGTAHKGIYIYKIDENDGIPKSPTEIQTRDSGKQLHAIGIDKENENVFYVGWDAEGQNIDIYTRDQSNNWTANANDRINHPAQTSDIVIDDCKRIWAVRPASEQIFIYHQNKTPLAEIKFGTSNLFNLLILENYTLIASHGGVDFGLTRIEPSLNCRPVRQKK